MSSAEPQIKYQEVSPFQISEGFTSTLSHKMEPVKTSRIFLAAVAANLSAFAVGTCLGWTSPVAPKLKSDDTSDSPLDHKIDATADAWISSVVALGALVAPFVAGPLADKIGRKWVLLTSSVFFVVAYVLMMIAGEVWVLLVARLVQGFGVGFVMTVQPMYVGEIATDSVRGATGSLMQLFIVCCHLSAALSDIIGRKLTLLSGTLSLVASFIVLLVASEVWTIILGRVLQGIYIGFVLTVQPMYVSEISTDETRGATGSLIQLFVATGTLYVYAIGSYVSYQALQWCCIAVPFCFAAIFTFMPESPYFYVSKGRLEEASKALQILRGQSAERVEGALSSTQEFINQNYKQKATLKDVFITVGNRKAFVISGGLALFQMFSGNVAVLFNSQFIFESANTGFDAAICAIIVGAVQVIASSFTPLIVDRLGRKIIFLVSSAIMSIFLYALGAYFFISVSGGDTSHICWLPLTCVVIYISVYSVSFGALPLVVASELFPCSVKALGMALINSMATIASFMVTYSFPFLNELGTYYAFWLFATCCLISFFFVLSFVFETKGLSFQEIQEKLNKKQTAKLVEPYTCKI